MKFDDVALLLADHRHHVRGYLRMSLGDVGLTKIQDANSFAILEQALVQPMPPDVVVCDAALPGSDVVNLVRSIRRNEISNNPYLCIMALS